jgi:hypothetical protein
MWEPRHPTTLWAFTACYRDSFTFLPHITTDNGIAVLLYRHSWHLKKMYAYMFRLLLKQNEVET